MSAFVLTPALPEADSPPIVWQIRLHPPQDLVLPDPDAPTAAADDSTPSPTPAPTSPATTTTPSAALSPRSITYAEAAAFAASEGLAGYVETSARTGSNVTSAFDKVTREAHARHQADLAARKGSRSGAGSSFPLQGLGVAKDVGKGCC